MEADRTGAIKSDGILTYAFEELHNGAPDIMRRVKDAAFEITKGYSDALNRAVWAYDIETVESLTYTFLYKHKITENTGFLNMLKQELSISGWDFHYFSKDSMAGIRPSKKIRSLYWRRSLKHRIMKMFVKK